MITDPSYSLNENLVPEQLFDNPATPEKEADGISATKALSLAAQQGQTIYTVTKANYAEVLPKLNHSDVVMTDIRNGVNAGKTVTVHDTQITLNGWSGTGYTILDPNTGAGAYMIGGGVDGGFLQGFAFGLLAGMMPVLVSLMLINPIFAMVVGAILFLTETAYKWTNTIDKPQYTAGKYVGLVTGLIGLSIIAGPFMLTLSPLFIFGLMFAMMTAMYYIVADIISAKSNRYIRGEDIYEA